MKKAEGREGESVASSTLLRSLSRLLTFSLSVLLFASCANQVPPSGGAKDVKPPELLKASPDNYSTRFSGHDIILQFNEYIQLKDINSQLVVSPPLKYPVVSKLKKKVLFIHIDDTLAQNTTYTFNFGNAIADNNEGNSLEGYQFVFSTGEVIDSLTVSGRVENAYDMKAEKDVRVMLYRGEEDSLPYKRLPDYFARTDGEGTFTIRNVSPGSYKLFALKDNNSNYLFDDKEEAIAFADAPVTAGTAEHVLKLFKEQPGQRVLKSYSEEPGKAVVIYKRPLQSLVVFFLTDTASFGFHAIDFSSEKDTLTFWYRNLLSDSLSFVLTDGEARDTLTIRLKRADAKGKVKYTPALFSHQASRMESMMELGAPLIIRFNHPVEQHALSSIVLTEDSLPVSNFRASFTDGLNTQLQIDYIWKEKASYSLLLPAGVLTDIFGAKNDTIQLLLRTRAKTDYGTLAIRLQLPSSSTPFLLWLVDDKENIRRRNRVQSDTSFVYENLPPGIYRLKMVEDINGNGKWDTGDYLQHRQPETVHYYGESITVRANWDVEVKWLLDIRH